MITRAPAEIGMRLDEVDTPALLIDLDAFERNIARMRAAIAKYPVRLRPHSKTHKCAVIAHRQVAAGAVGLCCQKVGEAEALVHGGVKNVLVSNEIVGKAKIARLAALAREAEMSVCADDAGNVAELGEAASALRTRLAVLVELNVGANRCGVEDAEGALALARLIASTPGLRFGGLQAYHGSAQHIRDYGERRDAIERAAAKVEGAVALLARNGLACELVTGAGTGTYLFEAASGVYNELQAGSYIFMDADYRRNGGNPEAAPGDEFEQSLFVLSTVMSRPVRERAVIDAGMKAQSVDSGLPLVADFPDVEYVGASDEHGTLALRDPGRRLAIGEKIRLVPGHCDPTVNLHDWYVGYRGDRVEALWPIVARGPGF